MSEELKKCIREIPDFPRKGILFRDITPLVLDPGAFAAACDAIADRYRGRDIDKIAAIESRGFIFGAAVALRLGIGLVLLRKPGKLPYQTIRESYKLEYGEATLEMHTDAVERGERILIIDDLLATGGTAAAAASLIERAGGIVEELSFIVELTELDGREKIAGRRVHTLVSY